MLLSFQIKQINIINNNKKSHNLVHFPLIVALYVQNGYICMQSPFRILFSHKRHLMHTRIWCKTVCQLMLWTIWKQRKRTKNNRKKNTQNNKKMLRVNIWHAYVVINVINIAMENWIECLWGQYQRPSSISKVFYINIHLDEVFKEASAIEWNLLKSSSCLLWSTIFMAIAVFFSQLMKIKNNKQMCKYLISVDFFLSRS